jgi:hypothetical protein
MKESNTETRTDLHEKELWPDELLNSMLMQTKHVILGARRYHISAKSGTCVNSSQLLQATEYNILVVFSSDRWSGNNTIGRKGKVNVKLPMCLLN